MKRTRAKARDYVLATTLVASLVVAGSSYINSAMISLRSSAVGWVRS